MEMAFEPRPWVLPQKVYQQEASQGDSALGKLPSHLA